MSAAVRFYSRSGNTKAVAEAIAQVAGVPAVSVDDTQSVISSPVDVLVIGGALYAYGIDSHLKDYLKGLKKENVRKAVVFSTSWISKHALDLIRKELEAKGIQVAGETFHVKSSQAAGSADDAKTFAKKFL
ncbi:MAG: flavodoxin family protein [Clostridia bacterium]|nr:flavodoxin family protein [Clostridia bacterium]